MENKNDIVASILNIEGKTFKIINEYKDLCLVHYDANTISKTEQNDELRNVRGVIVDIEAKKVVCPSFGYTPTIVSNSLPEPNSLVKDSNGTEYKFPETFKISPVTEGTMIRVWKYDNEILFSTHRRINCDNSRWGTSGKFKELFMKYIGEFDLNSLVNDGNIANFILMDKDLTIATKFPMKSKDGLVIFIGVTDLNGNFVNIDTSFPSLKEFDTNSTNLFKTWDMSVEEANKHLTQGFYDFPAKEQSDILSLAEGVVITYTENDKNKVMIVNSEAYSRRIKIVDNDPNILHRCYKLINKSYYPKNPTTTDTYLQDYPSVPIMNEEEIGNVMEPIISELPGKISTDVELTNKLDKKSFELRLRNTLTWYAMSLSLPHQLNAFNCIKHLIDERKQICEIMCNNYDKFLIGNFEGFDMRGNEDTFKYIKHRIVNAREFAKVNTGSHRISKNLVLNNIRTGVMRDSGDWLYNIAKVLIRIPNKTSNECEDGICIPTQQLRFSN